MFLWFFLRPKLCIVISKMINDYNFQYNPFLRILLHSNTNPIMKLIGQDKIIISKESRRSNVMFYCLTAFFCCSNNMYFRRTNKFNKINSMQNEGVNLILVAIFLIVSKKSNDYDLLLEGCPLFLDTLLQ